MLRYKIARFALLQYGKKTKCKSNKMNNFALEQIIGFLHYIAGKEEEIKFQIKCFHIAKNAVGVLSNL